MSKINIPEPVSGNVVLSGHMDMPAEQRDAIMGGLATHNILSDAEAGCIYFSTVPDENNPLRLVVYEIFEDRAALEHHKVRTASTIWAQLTKDVVAEFEIKDIA